MLDQRVIGKYLQPCTGPTVSLPSTFDFDTMVIMALTRPNRRKERGVLWKMIQYVKLFGMNTTSREWEELYQNVPVTQLPWESGQPSSTLVRAIQQGKIRGRVLDVGCGAGTQAVWMAEQGLEVIGVDVAETAIALARALAAGRDVQAEFRLADAKRLPFSAASFDAVLDRGTYHHQAGQKPAYVSEVARVLKPGGKYLLLAFSSKMRWPKSVSLTEVHQQFERFFSLDELSDETHIQPDGRKVQLTSFLLTRTNG